ncbi:MAG: hypothetical protein V4719_01710 [Planctomycetota bacterium]
MDTARTYSSAVVGAPRGPDAVPAVMTSGDQPIVGIFGHADDFLHGMGLIIAK